jgi:hypothetical protein
MENDYRLLAATASRLVERSRRQVALDALLTDANKQNVINFAIQLLLAVGVGHKLLKQMVNWFEKV